MPDLKVFMIGEAAPSTANGGFGVAVSRIRQELSGYCELISIKTEEADHVSPKVIRDTKRHSSFQSTEITKDIISQNIHSGINSYLYTYTDDSTMTEQQVSELQLSWEKHTNEIVEVSEKYEFDVIYAHDWPSFEAATKLSKRAKKPLVLHVHSLDIDRIATNQKTWIYAVEKAALEQADQIISVSDYSADRMVEYYGIDRQKIATVHNTIASTFEAAPASPNIWKPEKQVLFVGRLASQKNLMRFLEMAQMLLAQDPEITFVIAGEGELRNPLIDAAASKGIGDKVHFVGHVDQEELKKLYHQSTLLCMPSVSEPFGLVALEATAAGLPVVISNQSGVKEVLPATPSADYWDKDAFVAHLQNLLGDAEFRTKVVSDNKESVSQLLEALGVKIAAILSETFKRSV